MTMKRMFTMLVMTFSLMVCQAQVTNKSIEQKIDSLQTQLDKLQRDYDYLNCEYKLNRIIHELDIFKNGLNTTSNSILMNCYHNNCESTLYMAYKLNYDSSLESYESKKSNAYVTIASISYKLEISDFNALEIELLKSCIDNIETSLVAAKSSLDYLKVVLDIYRKSL